MYLYWLQTTLLLASLLTADCNPAIKQIEDNWKSVFGNDQPNVQDIIQFLRPYVSEDQLAALSSFLVQFNSTNASKLPRTNNEEQESSIRSTASENIPENDSEYQPRILAPPNSSPENVTWPAPQKLRRPSWLTLNSTNNATLEQARPQNSSYPLWYRPPRNSSNANFHGNNSLPLVGQRPQNLSQSSWPIWFQALYPSNNNNSSNATLEEIRPPNSSYPLWHRPDGQNSSHVNSSTSSWSPSNHTTHRRALIESLPLSSDVEDAIDDTDVGQPIQKLVAVGNNDENEELIGNSLTIPISFVDPTGQFNIEIGITFSQELVEES